MRGYSLPCLLKAAVNGQTTTGCELAGGTLAELLAAGLGATVLGKGLAKIIPISKGPKGAKDAKGAKGAKGGEGDTAAGDTVAGDTAGGAAADTAGGIAGDVAGATADAGLGAEIVGGLETAGEIAALAVL
ncbi:MAG: hypothetical protein ACRDX8_13025 [Acidimicrobiales bacterium]